MAGFCCGMLYAIGVMILGVGVYAFIIGDIATILTYIDPARAEYVKQQERLAAFMEYRGLPKPLQQRIREYYDYLWDKRLVYNESTIIKDLPPGLSMEVSLFLKRELIENVPLFNGACDGFIREVALELHSVVCPPGDYCDLFRLNKDMFERVLSHYPEIGAQMEIFARQRYDNGANFS